MHGVSCRVESPLLFREVFPRTFLLVLAVTVVLLSRAVHRIAAYSFTFLSPKGLAIRIQASKETRK